LKIKNYLDAGGEERVSQLAGWKKRKLGKFTDLVGEEGL